MAIATKKPIRVQRTTQRQAATAYAMAQLGNPEHESGEGGTLRDALVITNEILLRAAKLPQPCNVWMTCSTLNADLRDRLTKEATGVTFGEAVRKVVEAGGNVSILLWNDLKRDGAFSPSLAGVLLDQWSGEGAKYPGRLAVRATGYLPALTPKIMHFVTAADAARNNWYLRVERPHLLEKLVGFHLDTALPAAVAWGDSDAKRFGSKLVEGFEEVFRVAGARAVRQEPSGIFHIPEPVYCG